MLPKINWQDEKEVKEIIKATKQNLKTKMKRDFNEVWKEINASINEKVAKIKQEEENGSAIPQVDFSEVQNNQVSESTMADFKEKGAMVVRNVIPRKTVEEWYLEFKHYLKENDYENQEIDPNLDTYFSNLKSQKPQIFNIFWSKCQINVRQHENVAATKQFLNQFWISEKNGERFFEGDKETAYSDRIRIRDAGDNTLGLSPHIDGGSVERWIDSSNQKIYEPIFSGDWKSYNPFDGEYRNQVENISSPAVCRAFRTYQGWIALTPQGPKDGTLQLVPMVKESTAYILLRAFLNDVAEDSLPGAIATKAQGVNADSHQALLNGLVSIPKLYPGDTVWWHCDLIHAVEDKHEGDIESSVTYIGSAPLCEKNKNFIALQKEAFLQGNSSPDFAAENRETDYKNRALVDDLTDLGKKQMGFVEWK